MGVDTRHIAFECGGSRDHGNDRDNNGEGEGDDGSGDGDGGSDLSHLANSDGESVFPSSRSTKSRSNGIILITSNINHPLI